MTNLLRLEEGTSYQPVAGKQVIASYGNDTAARAAVHSGAALVNRSHWGLIRLTGSTRNRYMHNQTTHDFNRLKPGEGRETAFLTSTARIIDLVTALAAEDAIWLITSPERFAILAGWMPRFVFFTDDVQFSDEGNNFAILSLLGPKSGQLLTNIGAGAIVAQKSIKGAHRLMEMAGIEGVRVAVGSGLVGEGYTLIVPTSGAASVWNALREAGAEAMGEAVWESLRIEQGRPAADKEITEHHNPLEAGLWESISFNKGCYIGQEIIARLDTYQKLKQQLWGLRLSAPVQPNTPLHVEGKEVGSVTSITTTPEGPFALGYIRTKAGGAGLRVQVGESSAEVVDLPYIRRARSDI